MTRDSFLGRLILGSALLIGLCQQAHADIVWPALVLEGRLISVWSIIGGLAIEIAFVKWIFSLAWRRAALVALVANAISTVAGIFAIPIAGLLWEFGPGGLINHWLSWGTFNPIAWAGTFLLATLITASIECLVYRDLYNLQVGWRRFGWIFLANSLSVGAAVGSVFVVPPDM